MGAASRNFEVNVFKLLIFHTFLQSIRLLSDGIKSFTRYCIDGIEPNIPRITQLMNAALKLIKKKLLR
jgi:fumarate hydratase class II